MLAISPCVTPSETVGFCRDDGSQMKALDPPQKPSEMEPGIELAVITRI